MTVERLDSVTIYDHIVTMKERSEKTVKVAELKARLSEYLRAVRRGHPVTVCERDTPIARLVPYRSTAEPLTVREPVRALQDVAVPPPLGRPVDSLAALLEERQPSR
jgi:prevent-host-death family protein